MDAPINAKQLLNNLLQKHYTEARAAKEQGQLVAWSASVAPQEFCETMGIQVVYPENHAAAIGARGGALDLLAVAEGNGYALDLCSYARVNLGYMEVQDCITENIPLPDLVISCNNICNTMHKWYENLACQLKVPLIMIDLPYNHSYAVEQQRVDYIKDQFIEAIRQLEIICGRPFDYARFQEVMQISVESARWWKYVTDLAQAVPSPLNGFEIFNYMALIVCMRGKPECAQAFQLMARELEDKIALGESAFAEGEKYRVIWEGIACWPYLSHNFKALKSRGINMVCSTYPGIWSLLYEANDLDAMARAYSGVTNNCSLDKQVDLRTGLIRNFSCDGAIYHVNRSCKVMDFMQYEMARRISAETGIPGVEFDGDQTDPRNFSTAQFETRIETLVEMMAAKKDVQGWTNVGVPWMASSDQEVQND